MPRARIIGRGRAGTSLALALASAGWNVDGPHPRAVAAVAAAGTDLLVLAVPDAAIAEVAAEVQPVASTVVAHLAGARGLDVLAPHERVASIHPLVALPGGELGAERLRGAWFATSGDPLAREVVAALGGQTVEVADHDRVRYHAAAVMASNHLVALLGEVERVAESVGVPLDAYLDLVRATVDNVARLGPRSALTGPVARGDHETVQQHEAALDDDQAEVYRVLTRAARRLVHERATHAMAPPR